jgi:hypothetical protein
MENLLSRCAVAIGLGDQLFDLLRHQPADGDSVFRSDRLCATNRGFVELNGEISPSHARILRGARKPRRDSRDRCVPNPEGGFANQGRGTLPLAGHCGRFSNRRARCRVIAATLGL